MKMTMHCCAADKLSLTVKVKNLAFFMFGRVVYIPTLANLLQPKSTYLGDESSLVSLEMQMVAYM